jgi:hypothetical protein
MSSKAIQTRVEEMTTILVLQLAHMQAQDWRARLATTVETALAH